MIFLRAFIFGVTLALAIGPIALLIIRYAVTDGFRAGLASACGAALADLTYATIALSVGSVLAPFLTAHAAQVHTIAAVTLIGFGLWLLWTAVQSRTSTSNPQQASRQVSHALAPLFTTYGLTVANPLTVIAFLAFIGQLPTHASMMTRVIAIAGLFMGSLIIQIVLATGGAFLGRVFSTRHGVQILNVISGLGIVFFGVSGLLH